MMLDRKKISFWTRIGAIVLAVIFVGSFLFYGIGNSNLGYNLFDILGGGSNKGQKEATTGNEDQIARAQSDLEADPQNPKIIKRLAALYIQNGQTDDAIQVLEQGREAAPEDATIPLYLGQAYDQKAQATSEDSERKDAYTKAADAYGAATQAKGNVPPQAYLAAAQDYEQAGDKGRAIQYYNGYLKVQPEGTQADAAKGRVSSLLKGGETTGGAGGAG